MTVRGSDGDREKRSSYLSSSYRLDETTDPNAVILRREDGPEAAAFGERASAEEVERAAWQDFGGRRWPGT